MDVVAQALVIIAGIAVFINAKNGTLGAWTRSKFLGLAPGQAATIGVPFALPGKASPEGPADPSAEPDVPAEPTSPEIPGLGELPKVDIPELVPAIFTTASYRAVI